MVEVDRNFMIVLVLIIYLLFLSVYSIHMAQGNFSIEDTICGGMLIHLLQDKHGKELTLNDAASVALMLYQNNQDSIQQAIQNGEHARTLGLIGFASDVDIATEIDSMPVLPLLEDGRLILGS